MRDATPSALLLDVSKADLKNDVIRPEFMSSPTTRSCRKMAGESEEGGLHAFHPRPALARIDGHACSCSATCRCCWSSPHFLIWAVAFLFLPINYQLLILAVAEVSSASYFPEFSVDRTTILTPVIYYTEIHVERRTLLPLKRGAHFWLLWYILYKTAQT